MAGLKRMRSIEQPKPNSIGNMHNAPLCAERLTNCNLNVSAAECPGTLRPLYTSINVYKWLPDYYPNDPWEVVGSSGPPEGAIVPWWKQPKDQWPYPAPWEPKIFGAFPAMWFNMRENIGAPIDPPNAPPWPTSPKYPPFGLTHVNTRPDQNGTKSVSTIKVHMLPDQWLEVTPHLSVWAEGKYQRSAKNNEQKAANQELSMKMGHR
jgi:hypothetical protein